jgi:hypothetical protein
MLGVENRHQTFKLNVGDGVVFSDLTGIRLCAPAPLRGKYVVLGVVRLTGVGTVISRRGAEARSFLQWKSIFRGRCLLMNVFTLRPCASARKYVMLGVVRLTGVATVFLTNPN